MSLSERIRPNSEAAPWVCEEVKRLERDLEETRKWSAAQARLLTTYSIDPSKIPNTELAMGRAASEQLADAQTKLSAAHSMVLTALEKRDEAVRELEAEKYLHEHDRVNYQCSARVALEVDKKLREELQTYKDAVDAQPWASDEPIRVQLDRLTRRIADLEGLIAHQGKRDAISEAALGAPFDEDLHEKHRLEAGHA